MIYYTNRVLLVLINCENTIFARFKRDFSTICFEKFSFGKTFHTPVSRESTVVSSVVASTP